MKKIFSLFLAFFLVFSLVSLPSVAAETPDISAFLLPKPQALRYMMFEAADRNATEGDDALYVVRQADMSVLSLSAEYEADREAFLKKYGLHDFTLIMQFDTSLDNTDDWNYTSDWDKEYSAPGAGQAAGIFWIGTDMMDKETVFDLHACTPEGDEYSKLADALLQRDVPDGDYSFNNFYFDWENHSLSVRVRYYMEWETYDGETIGERQSKFSEWSDVAIFGKNGNSITPEAPIGIYEAPVISDLKFVPPGKWEELGSLTYIQATPEQVWNIGIYYIMTEEGNFEGLETQISINGGEWQEYNTADAWGNWCLFNGSRTAYYETPRIEADSNVKLRVRFLGTHGPSEWSNVLELNGGGTQVVPEDPGNKPDDNPASDREKCALCGFCPVPLGLCIFLWLAIVLVIFIVIVVIIIIATRPKKCKNCGQKLKKKEETCPKCGTSVK